MKLWERLQLNQYLEENDVEDLAGYVGCKENGE